MELITSLRGPGLQLHLSRPSSPDSACYRKSRRADLRPRRALARLRATPKQTILVRVANSGRRRQRDKHERARPQTGYTSRGTVCTPSRPLNTHAVQFSQNKCAHPELKNFRPIKTQLDRGDIAQEKLAQDDDDEDMPELLDIRDVQGEFEAAVSP